MSSEYLRALLGRTEERTRIPGVIVGAYARNIALVKTDQRGIVRAFNTRLPNRTGLPVIIEQVHGEWQVTGLDYVAQPDPGPYHYVPQHNEGHTFNQANGGDDVVWLTKEQYTPLLVAPTNPASRSVRVMPGLYYDLEGKLHHFMTEFVIDLEPYVGVSEKAVLITLNCANGQITVTETEVVTPGQVPLALVRLRPGATAITWKDILDARDMPPTLVANALKRYENIASITRHTSTGVVYYPCTPAGLAQALSEAQSGDFIKVPSRLAVSSATVPQGVTVDFGMTQVGTMNCNGVALNYTVP